MTTIWVTFKVAGFHFWKAAPERRAYLRDVHRHLFHFRVEIEVTHSDREVELHDLMDDAKKTLVELYIADFSHFNFNGDSCETIASKVLTKLSYYRQKYADRWMAVEVSEDGEVGARVERRPNG